MTSSKTFQPRSHERSEPEADRMLKPHANESLGEETFESSNMPPRARSLLHLQQTIGNQAVQRMINRSRTSSVPTDDLARRIQAASSGGSALDSVIRDRLQASFNADLSSVRIHADDEADRLSRSVEAIAFTTGQDIFFRHGAYQPDAPDGLHLIAHETAHALQQANGPVEGAPVSGGVSISDPADQFERAADQSADHVMRGQAWNTPTAKSDMAVQRQDEPNPWNVSLLPPELHYMPTPPWDLSLSPGGLDVGYGPFHASAGGSPLSSSMNASLYYGSPLLPFPSDVTKDVNAGMAGLGSGNIGPALNMASTLGTLGTSPTMPFGAGVTLSSSPEEQYRFMLGIQGSF
jgi:hypothetical protein